MSTPPPPDGMPIGTIILTDNKGLSARLTPQPDISAIEVVMLLNLVVQLVTNRDALIRDWKSYLYEHKLDRHFTFASPGSTT